MEHMTFAHILLTRFAFRSQNKPNKRAGDDLYTRNDPLSPMWLDYRFPVFELACLPNVMAQTNQDFDWVLIVDPDLPVKYRQRLEALIARRKRTYLHELRPSDNLAGLDWLEKYIPSGTDLALTTNLDNDDILTIDFVEKLQSHVKGLGTKVPSIKFLGMKTSYQWQLYSSAKYPLGTWAPYHRINWFRSVGLSMLCKIPTRRLSCFSLHHSLADVWYAQGSDQQIEQIKREVWGPSGEELAKWSPKPLLRFHQELEKTSAPGGEDWKSLSPEDLYYDLSKDGLYVVQVDHFMNDQITRLFEYKSGNVRIDDTHFFPDDIRIDWDVFHKHRDIFRLSWQRYKKYSPEVSFLVNKLLLVSVTYRIRLTWWFLRH